MGGRESVKSVAMSGGAGLRTAPTVRKVVPLGERHLPARRRSPHPKESQLEHRAVSKQLSADVAIGKTLIMAVSIMATIFCIGTAGSVMVASGVVRTFSIIIPSAVKRTATIILTCCIVVAGPIVIAIFIKITCTIGNAGAIITVNACGSVNGKSAAETGFVGVAEFGKAAFQ